MADFMAILWLKAVFLLLVLALPAPHQLRWGEVVDQKTELTETAEWVHTDWDWEPTLCFEPLRLEWREVDCGFMEYRKEWPLVYYLRLQSGERSEWVEVSDEQYSSAVIGEMFRR